MIKYITTKYDGECFETGKAIKKGDRVLFNDRTRKVYAPGSPTHQQYKKDHPSKEKPRKKQTYHNWQDIYNR